MLGEDFFRKDSRELAKDLLGVILVHKTKDGTTSGVIVETESYHEDDEASHTFGGKTRRNRAMFGPGGHAYVYFTYGMHYCFNVVAGEAGVGEGVLIRALKPINGIDLMKKRRNKNNLKELCNGPAKLTQAMAITKANYGMSLFEGGDLYLKPPDEKHTFSIETGLRIGIGKAQEKPWRFWISDSKYTSR